MQRCLQLAGLATGNVAPNPMVGAVLVHDGRIIGEGYHKQYGYAHAEVNCIASVKENDQWLIAQSTLYVSLEPCSHWGKTPPCADLIIDNNIPKVVVGCRDPFEQVNGKGLEKLRAAGIEVLTGILEKECIQLNKRFFTFHQKERPYIILKWAQSLDGKIARALYPTLGNVDDAQGLVSDHFATQNTTGKIDIPTAKGNGINAPEGDKEAARLFISNDFSNRIVHKWRSEEAAIMVGTNTTLYDDPQLGTRLWPGRHPVRIVLDMQLRLPLWLQVFDGSVPTIVFNRERHSLPSGNIDATGLTGVHFYQLSNENHLADAITTALYQLNIQSILVEGGAQLLQSFIDAGLWDEARIITNEALVIGDGLPAPVLRRQQFYCSESFADDTIRYYHNSIP